MPSYGHTGGVTLKAEFKMDPNLLRQVILDQAGDWKKGFLEAVQNSIDALTMANIPYNKGFIRFELKAPNVLTITDNGTGMTRTMIEEYFSTFGISIKSGNADTIGEKGVGRGQIFTIVYDRETRTPIGKLEFITKSIETGESTIVTDIDVNNLSYEYHDHRSNIGHGSTWELTLFEDRTWDTGEIYKYLHEHARYCPYKIYIYNRGKQVISENYRSLKFDIKEDTDQYFIGINLYNNGIHLYDRGILIKKDDDIFGGVSGIVVFKAPIRLNFARNDIMSEDKLYVLVKKIIQHKTTMKLVTRRNLAPRQATELLKAAVADSRLKELIYNRRFIHGVGNKKYSIQDIEGMNIVLADDSDRFTDALLIHGEIVIYRGGYEQKEAMRELGCSISDVEEAMKCSGALESHREQISLESTPMYKQDALQWLEYFSEGITIYIGRSDISNAWTDCRTKMVINDSIPDWAAWRHGDKVTFLISVMEVMSHELTHNDLDTDSEYHDVEFYQKQNAKLIDMFRTFAKVMDIRAV